MRKFHRAPGYLMAAAMLAVWPMPAGAEVAPRQWLLEQVRTGEATHQELLVEQSLHRLELIDPDDPETVGARLRLALRQGNQDLARRRLDMLRRLAPDSPITRQAELAMSLATPQVRQQLQQARLLATAGRLPEAKAAYDELFHAQPPTLDLAVEYWRLVARLPGGAVDSLDRLQRLDRQYAGNVPLRALMAKLLFDQGHDAQGYTVLRQLAGDPEGRGQAAEIWLRNIKAMPVGGASIAGLRDFIATFTDGDQNLAARDELSRQERLLADPDYQARIAGLAKVERGEGATAIPALRQALDQAPDDPAVLGALGLAYARTGQRQRAIDLFEQAQKVDRNGFHSEKWRSLINNTRYWLLLSQADAAVKAANLPLARQRYLQARRLKPAEKEAWMGLGEIALAGADDAAAEEYYRQALRLDPASGGAVRALATIYQRRSPQRAIDFLSQLSPHQRAMMQERLDALQADILIERAENYAARGQWAEAASCYQQARRLAPDRVWLTYHLAQSQRAVGRSQEADAVFYPLLKQRPTDPELGYAYALYLSAGDRSADALGHLRTLPAAAAASQWGPAIGDLTRRLRLRVKLERATQLRATGNESAAIALLSASPMDDGSALLLADWALVRGDNAAALRDYRRVATPGPEYRTARLGEIEALIAMDQISEARRRLMLLPPATPDNRDSRNAQRRIAAFWDAVGEPKKSLALLLPLQATGAAPAEPLTDALIWRDSARLERQLGRPEAAMEDNRRAMVASGITARAPENHADYTRLTRYQADDDWLQRGIRGDGADLARQREVTVTLDHDYWSSSGTGGISNLAAYNTMLQADLPWQDGRAFFRIDSVQMDAGRFTTVNGSHNKTFGACASVGCDEQLRQTASGASLATGWQNDRWQGDIGTTPLGFEVVDWVGGLSRSGDWQHIGWTATVSRRPIASSLLAFAGTRDPATGITWGGVRATGVNLAANYDRGEANGVWSNLGIQQLTGRNVADNQRARLMAGYYRKLINENNQRVTLGLNSMWWHYKKNLSHYSLGQGGYYSPQHYRSFSVPLNYRQRTDNWSWELGGTLGWSRSSTGDYRRYPLPALIPAGYADRNAVESGGSGGGIGYTLLALVERRLSSHWTLGAGVDVQQAKDYTPSHALMYLRYSPAGWQGDLDSPPRPLTPYADFR